MKSLFLLLYFILWISMGISLVVGIRPIPFPTISPIGRSFPLYMALPGNDTSSGSLLVYGGWSDASDTTLDEFWILDMLQATWYSVSPSSTSISPKLGGSMGYLSNGSIFLQGGSNPQTSMDYIYSTSMSSSTSFISFTNSTEYRIDQVISNGYNSCFGYTLPSNLYPACTQDYDHNITYCYGGLYYNGTNWMVSSNLTAYNEENQCWEEILSNLNVPLYGASMSYFNESIYIFGGASVFNSTVDTDLCNHIYQYNITSQTWNLTSPSSPIKPNARLWTSSVIYNDGLNTFLLISGGLVNQSLITISGSSIPLSNEIWKFDLLNLYWSLVPFNLSSQGVAGHASGINYPVLYTFGGTDSNIRTDYNTTAYDLIQSREISAYLNSTFIITINPDSITGSTVGATFLFIGWGFATTGYPNDLHNNNGLNLIILDSTPCTILNSTYNQIYCKVVCPSVGFSSIHLEVYNSTLIYTPQNTKIPYQESYSITKPNRFCIGSSYTVPSPTNPKDNTTNTNPNHSNEPTTPSTTSSDPLTSFLHFFQNPGYIYIIIMSVAGVGILFLCICSCCLIRRIKRKSKVKSNERNQSMIKTKSDMTSTTVSITTTSDMIKDDIKKVHFDYDLSNSPSSTVSSHQRLILQQSQSLSPSQQNNSPLNQLRPRSSFLMSGYEKPSLASLDEETVTTDQEPTITTTNTTTTAGSTSISNVAITTSNENTLSITTMNGIENVPPITPSTISLKTSPNATITSHASLHSKSTSPTTTAPASLSRASTRDTVTPTDTVRSRLSTGPPRSNTKIVSISPGTTQIYFVNSNSNEYSPISNSPPSSSTLSQPPKHSINTIRRISPSITNTSTTTSSISDLNTTATTATTTISTNDNNNNNVNSNTNTDAGINHFESTSEISFTPSVQNSSPVSDSLKVPSSDQLINRDRDRGINSNASSSSHPHHHPHRHYPHYNSNSNNTNNYINANSPSGSASSTVRSSIELSPTGSNAGSLYNLPKSAMKNNNASPRESNLSLSINRANLSSSGGGNNGMGVGLSPKLPHHSNINYRSKSSSIGKSSSSSLNSSTSNSLRKNNNMMNISPNNTTSILSSRRIISTSNSPTGTSTTNPLLLSSSTPSPSISSSSLSSSRRINNTSPTGTTVIPSKRSNNSNISPNGTTSLNSTKRNPNQLGNTSSNSNNNSNGIGGNITTSLNNNHSNSENIGTHSNTNRSTNGTIAAAVTLPSIPSVSLSSSISSSLSQPINPISTSTSNPSSSSPSSPASTSTSTSTSSKQAQNNNTMNINPSKRYNNTNTSNNSSLPGLNANRIGNPPLRVQRYPSPSSSSPSSISSPSSTSNNTTTHSNHLNSSSSNQNNNNNNNNHKHNNNNSSMSSSSYVGHGRGSNIPSKVNMYSNLKTNSTKKI